MNLNSLTAISPIDGRYRKTTEALAVYFSEFALIKQRVYVEIKYFIALSKFGLPQFPPIDALKESLLESIYINFSLEDALHVKEIEKITNHDVKAVEYFIKEKINAIGLNTYAEFIHFGLTSQDINNTSTPLLLKAASESVLFPAISDLINKIKALSKSWKEVSMLSRTHGQAASPTKLGKEFFVFVERLNIQFKQLQDVPFSAKFGGAIGNFNAHQIAYPAYNWIEFGNDFVNTNLGLKRSQFTTQIEHYDNLAAYCDALKRINTILIDLSKDVWAYVSMDYFKQQLKAEEIGSSAMPHKVNPIDFENAEGNLGLANAYLEHLSAKLPISRLQRDLSDSTVLRNLGMPLAHSLISYTGLLKGLNKLILNEAVIKQDLENNWAVISEAIQTILRREGFANPYETLKELTRKNTKIDQFQMKEFINGLSVSDEIKSELHQITPHNYTGVNFKF